MTLNEWTEQWLETYVKPVAKPSGYEHYCDNMYKHILPKLGNLPMNELTTAVVQQFLNGEALHGNLRTGGPLSAKSVKNMRVVLDVCCKRAVADGIMPVNPVPATVYTHCRSKKLTVLSDDAQATLEKCCFPTCRSTTRALFLRSTPECGSARSARCGGRITTRRAARCILRRRFGASRSTRARNTENAQNWCSARRKLRLRNVLSTCRKCCKAC